MTNQSGLTQRSPVAVFLLPIVTFGIYSIVWYAKTRGEVNSMGANAMTTWWLLVPFAPIWYFWSLAKGIEKVTGISPGGNYALMLLLGSIGQTIVQARMNGNTVPALSTPVPATA